MAIRTVLQPRRSLLCRPPPLWGAGSALWLCGCFLQDDFYIDHQPGVLGVPSTAVGTDNPSPSGTAAEPDDDDSTGVVEETDGVVIGANPDPAGQSDASASSGASETDDANLAPDTSEPTAAQPDDAEQDDAEVLDAGTAPATSDSEPESPSGLVEAGAPPSVACATFSAWGEPVRRSECALTGMDLWSPSLSGDGLELYFAATSSRDEQIYVSRRATPSAKFGAPTPIAELNAWTIDGTPAISADGLTIVFSSERNINGRDLFIATRATRESPFGEPVSLDELNTTGTDYLPWLSDDGLTLLYASGLYTTGGGFGGGRPGSGGLGYYTNMDIFIATRASTSDPFVSGGALAGINSDANDERSVFSSGGLAIYFTSDRNDSSGVYDIFLATRDDLESDFGEPTALTSQNTGSQEQDVTLSRDMLELFYSSDRSGTMSFWHARRTCADQ